MPRGKNPKSLENLVKSSDLTPEERSERARKAGKAPKRKRVKTLRQLARIINAADIQNANWRDHVLELGLTDEEDMINAAVIAAGVFHAAIAGNLQAVQKWEELTAPPERKKKRAAESASDPLSRSLMDLAKNLKSDPVPGEDDDEKDRSGEGQASDD